MSTFEDRWFEVWVDEGEDLCPTWVLIVTPDTTRRGYVVVYDPQENYRVVHQGENYESTCRWLMEDEYSLVEGRMFPDDGLPINTSEKTLLRPSQE